ncbi:MAG TPA: peptidylprolyl isomerase [Candidatus Krumholzibacteriaceae bacterium]|nr:peptidylprolyl isomerase [Candidatus Krumholzibacteriaceae bacterium]
MEGGKRSIFRMMAVLLVLILLSSACQEKKDPGDTQPSPGDIVRVGEKVFTKEGFENLLPRDQDGLYTAEDRRSYINRWIDVELCYQEALRRGLKDDPRVKARIKNLEKEYLADHLLFLEMRERIQIEEKEIKDYFEEHRREYEREYRVRHILLNSREEAEKVKNLLKRNSFPYIANKYSVDPVAGRGGDLGYLTKENMIPEFESVVFEMQPGEVSDIVKSDFGYHIIKLVGSRKTLGTVHLSDVREQIMNILMVEKRKKAYREFMESLRGKIGVEFYDERYRQNSDSAETYSKASSQR